MMKVITTMTTSYAESMKLAKGFALSPATRMPAPKNRAMTMTGSISALVKLFHIFVGKMLTITSMTLEVAASYS